MPWKINDSLPAILAQEFAPPAEEWPSSYWGPALLAFNDAQGGAPAITGTAALDGIPGTIASTGAEVFTGTAAPQGQPGAVASVGQQVFSGAASPAGQSGSIAAQGEESFGGTGALAGTPGAIASDGSLGFAGAGVLEGAPGSFDADCAQVFGGEAGLAASSGEMLALGTVGDPLPGEITGTADLVGTPGELTAEGEYTPLAITGEAALEGNPGELSALETIEIEDQPISGMVLVVEQGPKRRGPRIAIVSPELLANLTESAEAHNEELSEALTSGPTGALDSVGEAELLAPEPAGSADVSDEITLAEEVITSAVDDERAAPKSPGAPVTAGVVAEVEAAAPVVLPDEAVSGVVPITPEAVDAILAAEPIDDEAGLILAIVMALDEAGV